MLYIYIYIIYICYISVHVNIPLLPSPLVLLLPRKCSDLNTDLRVYRHPNLANSWEVFPLTGSRLLSKETRLQTTRRWIRPVRSPPRWRRWRRWWPRWWWTRWWWWPSRLRREANAQSGQATHHRLSLQRYSIFTGKISPSLVSLLSTTATTTTTITTSTATATATTRLRP